MKKSFLFFAAAIAREEEVYSISVDAVDTNGHVVRAVFDGELLFRNMSASGSSAAARPMGMPCHRISR
ncbi:MAG: hypothetical protein K2H81_02075 [Alistipes sp.]|nr:hypothetical protein [Alistipes sp.]